MDGRAFFAQIQRLIDRAGDAEFRLPEDSALIGVANDLTPKVSRLLRDSLTLLEYVEEAAQATVGQDEGSEPGRPLGSDDESLLDIASLIATDVAGREIADLAFFASCELRGALGELERAVTRNHVLATARQCEAGVRSALRALVSVEAALFRWEDLEPPERTWADVEVSLEIRRLYRDLRRDILARERARPGAHEDLLRTVLYRLLAFRELRVYPFLRVDDRVHLRSLLQRMLEWLNSAERDAEIAQRLWQDLREFAQILAQVSFRQELREHDRRQLARAYRALFGDGRMPRAHVPSGVHTDLRRLLGLDDELDALLEADPVPPSAAWRSAILRLLGDLHGLEEAGASAASTDGGAGNRTAPMLSKNPW